MTKEQMMNDIIHRYGFESAIGFCKLVEDGADESIIEYWYKILMDIDYKEYKDEDYDDYDYEDDFDE